MRTLRENVTERALHGESQAGSAGMNVSLCRLLCPSSTVSLVNVHITTRTCHPSKALHRTDQQGNCIYNDPGTTKTPPNNYEFPFYEGQY